MEPRDLYSTVLPPSPSLAAPRADQPDRWQTIAGSPQGDPGPAMTAGRRIGNYVVERELGRGGMGVVYAATHQQFTDRRYALKLISDAASSPGAVERFQREVEAIGKSEHSHVLYAVDAGLHEGDPYLVTELVEGYDIGKIIRHHGPLDVAVACEIGRQLALGLQFIHAANIVHRDVKPQNVMLEPDGQIKILDLGLASLCDASAEGLRAADGIMGTPVYMPPEQWRGEPPRPASDVYAFGCMLFEMLTGQPPFPNTTHGTVTAQREAHLHQPAPRVSVHAAATPSDVARLIERCLQKSPDDRPQDCGDIVTILEHHAGPIDTADVFSRIPDHRTSPITEGIGYDKFVEGIRFPKATPRARTWFVAVFGCSLVASLSCLAMAYFGPQATSAWELRFDRLANPALPMGIGFAVEAVRSVLFLTCVFAVGYRRFSQPLARLFSIHLHTWRVWVARLFLASVLTVFLGFEANRLWRPEHAASGMVAWAEKHGITTTAFDEVIPYRWYLGYTVIQYTFILGGMMVLPVLQFLLSDLQYVNRSLVLFSEAQRREPNAMQAIDRLSTLARHFRRLATRYVDTAGVMAIGIQYEYWIGRWTLSEMGYLIEVVGMLLTAAVMVAILAYVASRYAEAVEVTSFGRGGKPDHRIERMVGQFNVIWLMKSAFFSRPSGFAVLSLLILIFT